MARPSLKFQKPKRVHRETDKQQFSVFDSDIEKIVGLAEELRRLKEKYQKAIDDFLISAEQTKQGLTAQTKRELLELTKKYQEDIDELADNFSISAKNTKEEVMADFSKVLELFGSQSSSLLLKVKEELSKSLEKVSQTVQHAEKSLTKVENAAAKIKLVKKGDKGDKPIAGIDFPFPKPGEPGKNAVVDVIDLAKKMIKLLPEEGLEIRHIKNLRAELRNLASKTMLGGAKGGGGSWHQKTLSGDIDGSNKVYTFTGVEPAEFGERVFLNYIEQNPVNGDYTINYKTNTVTYDAAPDASLSGKPHIIRYHA